jgi:hypothetical protein
VREGVAGFKLISFLLQISQSLDFGLLEGAVAEEEPEGVGLKGIVSAAS